MKRVLLWSLAGLFVMGLIYLIFLPAALLATVIEQKTGGRIALGDAEGSLWRGSAFIGTVATSEAALTPLLPGRFSWRLSPLLLLGRVDLLLENSEALSQPLEIKGSWRQWQLGPSGVLLPAERLIALGSPLNTIRPSGQMRLSWQSLKFASDAKGLLIDGRMQLDMTEIASALSPVKPLGAYRLQLDWHGNQALLELATSAGPLMLSGTGVIANQHLQFSGEASAQKGQEERLAMLLNLLGQRRQVGNKNIYALEFK